MILLNPTITFQQRLKDAQSKDAALINWQDIHKLALSHSTWQWRWYLTFWELKLAELVRHLCKRSRLELISLQISKAHVSRVKGRTTNERMPVLIIGYEDFQDVQVIHDRMNAAKYVLSLNTVICKKAKKEFFQTAQIDLFLDELELQSNRVDNLLERARSGSTLVGPCKSTLRTELTN